MELDDFDPDAAADPASGRLFGLPHRVEDAAVVVVPVPFEATTSYGRGTAGGPEAVLAASAQVDLHDLDTGEPWRAGMAMEPVDPRIERWNQEACEAAVPVIAAGGAGTPALQAAAERVNDIGARLNALVEDKVGAILDRGRIPAVLGGDHSVPFGAMVAAARRYPGLGILHVDAHADLRRAYEGFTWSHASILYNVRTRIPDLGHVVQVGLRDVGRAEAEMIQEDPGITAFTDSEIAWELAGGEPFLTVAARMVRPLPKDVWVTFDIDGLDPALCPGTGTPVPGGLSWREALLLLKVLGSSGRRIVGFDLCEVGPGEWDANVGARLLYKLAGWAVATR